MKFKKIQRWLALIPIISYFGIAFYTYINLAKYKASFIRWVSFVSLSIVFVFASSIANDLVSAESLKVLDFFIKYILGIGYSLLLIELQLSRMDEKTLTIPKNIKIVLIAVAITFMLCVISTTLVPTLIDATKNYNKLVVEDTNGAEDYSLVKITKEQLINSEECSILIYSESKEGNSSLIEDKIFQDYDYDKLLFYSGKFNGVTTVHATKTDNERVKLNVNTLLKKGNAEIDVIVDGQYYKNVEINKQTEIVIDDAQNKMILIKVAGESADIRIEVKRNYS